MAAILFGTAMLAGCGGGPGPETAALAAKPLAKSETRLKIARPELLYGMAVDVRVKVDGREIGSLGNGDVKIVDLPAGVHQVVVDHWSHPNVFKLDLQAKPGMVYELEISPREEAAVAGLMFGLAGTLAEAAANENGGGWQVRMVGQKPANV